MTSSDVRKLVEGQVGDRWDRTNLHGVQLRHCIVEPKFMTFVDVSGKSLNAWLVLLENPETRIGYGIAYEETAAEFGLVQFAVGYEPCLLGLYGDFFSTLEAM